ncbi:MAG: Hsp20/alpha crystallin family protein [Salinirussus sp.]
MRIGTNPFEEMERLLEQTRRSMMQARPHGLTPVTQGHPSGLEVLSSNDVNLGMEAVDDGYVVTADMPGFEKDDIELRFDDGVLTIRGEIEVTEESETGWHNRSRRVREQLAIPGDVREDEIEASYRNGVLEVRLPTEQQPEDDSHRIDID